MKLTDTAEFICMCGGMWEIQGERGGGGILAALKEG